MKFYTSEEFVVGKHNIVGWFSNSLLKSLPATFQAKSLPVYKKLERSMTDAEIEEEFTPGLCEAGDILAFLDNAPQETKNGFANILYTLSFVVYVGWRSDRAGWYVCTWDRGDGRWGAGYRVLSPATIHFGTKDLTLGNSESFTLERAIELVKKEGYKVFKEI